MITSRARSSYILHTYCMMFALTGRDTRSSLYMAEHHVRTSRIMLGCSRMHFLFQGTLHCAQCASFAWPTSHAYDQTALSVEPFPILYDMVMKGHTWGLKLPRVTGDVDSNDEMVCVSKGSYRRRYRGRSRLCCSPCSTCISSVHQFSASVEYRAQSMSTHSTRMAETHVSVHM